MPKKKEGDGFGKTKTGNRRTPRAWDNPIPSYKRKTGGERRDERPFGKAKTEGRDFDKRPGDDRRSDDKPFRRSFRRDDRDTNTERRGFRRDDRDSGPEKRGFRRDDRTGDSDRKSSFRRRDDNDRPFEKKSFEKRGERPFRRDERGDRSERPFNRRDDRNDDRRGFRRDERPSDDDRRRSERPFDPEKRPSRNRLSGPEERPFRKSYRRDDDRSDDRRGSDRRGGYAKRSDDKPVGGYRKRRDDVSFDEVKPRDKRRFDETDKRPFGRDKRDDRNERPFGRRSDRRDDKRGTPPSYDLKSYEQKERGRGRDKTKETDPENEEVRLNRYIANAGICSRREADVLIESGEIKVNGKVVTEMGFKVKPGDIVQYGKRTLSREKMVYVMLNKPKDYITTTDDPDERHTVMELVQDACQERIYPVGRLDRNTTGLLLLTNDGELAEKLAHPSNEIQKLYEVELDKPITPEDYQAIIDGVELEDGLAKVDDLAIVSPDRKFIGVALHLGRNRIVRRIFEHLGYKVVKLDRTVYAGITKKDLPRGRWRYLTEREVIRLKYFV